MSSILRGAIAPVAAAGSGITSGSGVGAGSGVAVGAVVGAGSGAAMVSGVGVDIGIAVDSDVGLETGVAIGADLFVGTRVGAELEQANSAANVTRIAQCSSFDMLNLLHLKVLSDIVSQPTSGDA